MTPAGIEPATFQFVAQHLNHCATAVPEAGTGNKLMATQQLQSTGRFIMYSVITNIYNKKTKGPILFLTYVLLSTIYRAFHNVLHDYKHL